MVGDGAMPRRDLGGHLLCERRHFMGDTVGVELVVGKRPHLVGSVGVGVRVRVGVGVGRGTWVVGVGRGPWVVSTPRAKCLAVMVVHTRGIGRRQCPVARWFCWTPAPGRDLNWG